MLAGTWIVLDSGGFINDRGQDHIHILNIRVPNQFQIFVVKTRESTNRESLYHSAIVVGTQPNTFCKAIKLPSPTLALTRDWGS